MMLTRSTSLIAVLGLACACSGSTAPVSSSTSTNPPDDPPKNDAPPPTADEVKQHTLLLVSETPRPGTPTPAGSSPIYVVHGDGTNKTLLTDEGGMPNWTPDGAILFVSNRSGSQQIWIMDADGSHARQIGDLPESTLPLMPQIAKNGLIAFMGADANGGNGDNPGIWTMHDDGSELTEVTTGQQPSLALSGTWIAYTYETENPYHREIWRINTDGTGKQQLTFLGDPDYPDANAPNISPDESTVAFFSGKESDKGAAGATQSAFTFGHRNVAIAPATGGARTTLTACKPVTTQAEMDATTTCIAADNPAWSPDGAWLIFDTGSKTGGQTWMVDRNGDGFQSFYTGSRGTVRVALKRY